VNPLGLNDDGLFELRSYKAWMQNARRSGITDEQQQAYLFRANRSLDRLERRFGLKPGQATRIDLMEPGDARKLAFRETMDPLRKMNGPATRLKHVGTFDESALNAIDDASYYFPESWWNKAGDYIGADGGTIDLIRTPRGYFMQRPTGPDVAKLIGKPKTTIALSGELVDTAIHELMHLMQRSVFGISRLEKQFYARRVKGERLKNMPGYGYSTSQKTRADAFYHPYVGKDYGSGGIKNAEPREVATMGIEGLNGMQTGNRTLSEIDEEHADLIFSMFGLLP
jgi:hypothetical protein